MFLGLFFFFAILSINIECKFTDIFSTVSLMKSYADSVVEYQTPDNIDWENPSYATYQKSLAPGYLYSFALDLGLVKPLWSEQGLTQILQELITKRQYLGYHGRFAQKITPVPGSRFIIFGELQGALHSLVRDLEFLKGQNIINENLEIIKPDHYIVFNGNNFSRSAYALETLTAIIRLMLANPEKVITICGHQEDKERWQHYALKSAVLYRMTSNQGQMLNLINEFFNTLPLALYLIANYSQKSIDVVRISSYATDNKELNEKNFKNLFTNPKIQIISFDEPQKKTSDVEINLKAIIRGESYFRSQQLISKGLHLSGKEEGATGWIALSGPTQSYQRLFNFYYDAFVILTTSTDLDDWILDLYNKDIRVKGTMKIDKAYKLMSGLEIPEAEAQRLRTKSIEEEKNWYKSLMSNLGNQLTALSEGKIITELIVPEKPTAIAAIPTPAKKIIPLGKNPNVISIGVTLDLTDGLKDEGFALEGALSYVFNKYNDQGGIKGKKFQLHVFDDGYTPSKSRQNVLKILKEYKTGLILNSLGTIPTEGIIDLVEMGDIALLFPATGSLDFRKPELKNLINLRDNYFNEAYLITKYAIQTLKAKKLVLFYQNDKFGITALKGSQKALQELGITGTIEISYERNDLNFGERIDTIRKSNADCVGFLSTTAATKELLNQLGSQWVAAKKLFGITTMSTQEFRKYIERNQLNFAFTSIVPDPATSDLEIVQKFRDDLKDNPQLKSDGYALEAYISAHLFAHVLKNIDEPITTEKIIAYLENLKNYNFQGLNLNFDPNTRQLSHTIWLNTGSGPWHVLESLPTKDYLSVGSTMDLSRGAKDLGSAVKQSIELAFEKNPIPDLHVELTILDDQYTPENAAENVRLLIDKFKSQLLLCPLGSQTFAQYVKVIEDGKIATLFPIPGIAYRRPILKSLIYFRPSYADEAIVLGNYIIKSAKPQKVAIFYQDDDFGKAGLLEIKKLFDAEKIETLLLPYKRNDTDFSVQVAALSNINIEYIVMFAVPVAALQFTQQLGTQYVRGKIFYGISIIAEPSFIKKVTEKQVKIVTTNMVPDPLTSALPIAQEFRQYAQDNIMELGNMGFEAYIGTKILLDVVKNIKGPLTKDTIIAGMETLKNRDLGGIKLNFDPQTRQLSKAIWINEGKTPWTEVDTSVEPIKSAAPSEPVAPIKKPEAQAPIKEGKGSVVIGSTMDLSRGIKDFGTAVKQSIELAIEKNPIPHLNVELIILDDQYTPANAAENVRLLIDKFKSQLLLCPLGSQTFTEFMNLIKEDKIAAIFPIPGTFPRPILKSILYFRPSFADESRVLGDFLVKAGKSKKVAIFYQDDDYGKTCLTAVKKVLDAAVIESLLLPYKRNDTNFNAQVATLKKTQVNDIILLAVPKAANEFLKQLGDEYTKGKILYGTSDLGDPSFIKNAQANQLAIVITNVVPDPLTSTLPIAQEFRQYAQDNVMALGNMGFEAYIGTKILLDVIKNVKGPLTKDAIVAGMEIIKNRDFGGIKLNFDPQVRRLSNAIWINEGKTPWTQIDIIEQPTKAESTI